MRILFGIVEISRDRRSKAQLESIRATEQARADRDLERLYNERVAANVARRLDRRVQQFLQTPAILRRQAD